MAKRGFLKVATDTKKDGTPLVTKNGNPYVRLLILDHPDDDEGTWMSLWDQAFFGGTEAEPTGFDVRDYENRNDPPAVVYEAEQSGDFVNCVRIRLDSEAEQEAIHEAVESVAKPTGDTEALKNAIDLAEIGVEQAQLGIARAKEALAELVPF